MRAAPAATAVFILGLIAYVEGHGMHLLANAFDRLLHGQEDAALDQAVFLFDEVTGHFIWDLGGLLIAVGLVLAGTKATFASFSPLRWILIAC